MYAEGLDWLNVGPTLVKGGGWEKTKKKGGGWGWDLAAAEKGRFVEFLTHAWRHTHIFVLDMQLNLRTRVTKFKFYSFKKEWKGGDPWSLVTIKEEKKRKAELTSVISHMA